VEQLPTGRHGLDRAFVVANQRDRILDALAQEVAEKGYRAVTVSDVIARAGVSSKTFYEFFRGKADCFLATYDAAVATLMGHVDVVYQRMPDPTPEQTRAVLGTMLEVFAAEPALARMCLVEVAAAGPEAMQRYVAAVDGFIRLLEPLYRVRARRLGAESSEPDPVQGRALVGGIAWVIYGRIVAGETKRLPELLPQLLQFLFAPFLGDEEAARIAFTQPADSRARARTRGGSASAQRARVPSERKNRRSRRTATA
jgi:AcrR family transcriptional regulator